MIKSKVRIRDNNVNFDLIITFIPGMDWLDINLSNNPQRLQVSVNAVLHARLWELT